MEVFPRDLKPGDVLSDGFTVRAVRDATFQNVVPVAGHESDGTIGRRELRVPVKVSVTRDGIDAQGNDSAIPTGDRFDPPNLT